MDGRNLRTIPLRALNTRAQTHTQATHTIGSDSHYQMTQARPTPLLY